LISFLYPIPKGCKENQFAPFRVWGNQIDFQTIGTYLGKQTDKHIKQPLVV